jgi:hypothetical protein
MAIAMLSLAGCGVRPSGVIYAGEAPVATAPASPSTMIYLLEKGVIPVPVAREVVPLDPQHVFDALLDGPTDEERAKGLTTALSGIKTVSVSEVAGEGIFIDSVPPAEKLPSEAIEQLVCTGSALPDRPRVFISTISGAKPYQIPRCQQNANGPTPLPGLP